VVGVRPVGPVCDLRGCVEVERPSGQLPEKPLATLITSKALVASFGWLAQLTDGLQSSIRRLALTSRAEHDHECHS
jgi:hypothetical protein